MKKWIIGIVVKKIIKLAMEKADVTIYVEAAADAVDGYLDKVAGEKTSETVQKAVVTWINQTVTAFTKKLEEN